MNWKTPTRIVFAMTMIAVSVIGYINGSFAPVLAGVSHSLPDRLLLSYVCNVVLLACGAGLLVRRTASWAALILLVYLIVWTVLFKVPFIIRAPLVEVSYQTTGENLVLVAAAWVLWCDGANGRIALSGSTGRRIAYLLYGLALIAFGFSHFAYMNLTAPLVPAWLGPGVIWAYLTGCIYLATGLMLATGFAARLGAALAALQILLITILVWVPIVAAGNLSAMHWQETVVSCALTAAALVLAASFDDRGWFAPLWSSPPQPHAAAAQ
jgi:hypothetical protein